MHRLSFLIFVLFFMVMTGCSKSQMAKDSWKYTTKQYRTYLNTPASLDMQATGDCENYQIALGDAVLDVDEQLQKLIRAMENSDRKPDQEWVTNMVAQFPWLSGVALVDGEGKKIAQYPESFTKEFDVSPLLVPDPKQRIGSLRAYGQKTPLGPEVYLANPVYRGEQLRGLVVAHFDPRALAATSGAPGAFILASPIGVLWPGDFGAEGGPAGSTDWETLLTQKTCGLIGKGGTEFYWTTRFMGNFPLVYVIPTSAGKSYEAKAKEKETQESENKPQSPAPVNSAQAAQPEKEALPAPASVPVAE